MKKSFKMPNIFTLLLGITAFVAILTWIVPAGTYQYIDPNASKLSPIPNTYSRITQNPQGLWEIFQAPIIGISKAFDISLFLLIIGGFLTIIISTGAMNAGLSSVIKKFKGKELALIPILMTIMALGGTTFGLAEETIAFYPLLIPVFLAVGFDTIVVISVVLLGSGIGVLNSTVNPFATGVASGIAGVSIGDGIFLRLALLIIQLTIASFMVILYAKKIKANPSASLVYSQRKENIEHFIGKQTGEHLELTPKRKLILWIFSLTFFIMILGVIPWGSKFNIHIFEKAQIFIRNLPFIGLIIGNIPILGTWWFTEISVLFFISAILAGKIYGMNEKEIVSTFLLGTKDFISVALIVGVSRGITVIMDTGGMTSTILSIGEQGLANLGQTSYIVLSYIFFIPMALLIPSTSGLAALTMPIFTPIADFIEIPKSLVITAYQSASGIANLITPTASAVIGALTLSKVDFITWIKYISKFLLMLFITTIIGLIIGIYL